MIVSWNTTNRCNMSCKHCYRDAGNEYQDELNIKEAKNLIEEIAKAGFKILIFSGGEPFMRPDIYELVSHAVKNGLRPVFGSNGTLITPVMNDNEINLLNRIQDEFPIQKRPFLEVSHDLGMKEEDVITLIKELKENGYIRRLGGFFDTKSLGYVSTLCAMMVPDNRIEEVAKVINSYPGVTHNYIRKHEYNMWFTLTAKSGDTLESVLKEIRDKTGIDQIMNLPSTKTFKVKVHLCM